MNTALRVLSDRERLDWLRLSRSENVGPRTFANLLARYADAGAALAALPDLVRRKAAARPIAICSVEAAEQELERAHALGVTFVAQCEPAYPALLRRIDSAPPVIGVRGRIDLLQRPAVAIVGSRNASASGLVLTERLARGVGAGGYAVVSGLARGIDGKAHHSSLETGTIAVLAGGHDRVYPSEHEALARRIVERGVLISEMPLGWEPRARDFPRRNRIVSGLCLGVIVVEANRRSGSLITARFAAEQGREVFAVPGSPLDARAEGTNDLIRQGATLCSTVEHVLEALEPLRSGDASMPLAEPPRREPDAEPLWDELDLFGDLEQSMSHRSADLAEADPPFVEQGAQEPLGDPDAVLRLIGSAPIQIDDLIRASALPPSSLAVALVELEVLQKIQRHDGNRVSLAVQAG